MPNEDPPDLKNQQLGSPPHATSPLSPIPIHNKYGPLIRPKNPSISSSSSSGPLFPLGFESSIPTPIKNAHSKKKNKIPKSSQPNSSPSTKGPSQLPSLPHHNHTFQISAGDVLKFADELGLVYPGTRSELEKRINLILSRQKAKWSPLP